MSVIVELSLPAREFRLGRILCTEGDKRATLETMVPLGNGFVLFFRLFGPASEAFEAQARNHHSVSDIYIVSTQNGETLYALDWAVGEDSFLDGVLSLDGHVLEAAGGSDTWEFQLRFPSHSALSAFQESCFEADTQIDIRRIYNPIKPDAGPWYGLSEPQREAFVLAVKMGYYDIPRGCTTEELADELGISDQAVTERLRRAIGTFGQNAFLTTESDERE